MSVEDGGIQPHTLHRPRGLIQCDTVLDIGAGIRPMQWYTPRVHVCVEPFGPYADVLEEAGFVVGRLTAEQALRSMNADAVYLLDVLEHMDRAVGWRVVAAAVQAARRQVVIYTPMGFVEQTHDAWGMGGEAWQKHRSGWLPSDFSGWQTEADEVGFFATWTHNTGASA